ELHKKRVMEVMRDVELQRMDAMHTAQEKEQNRIAKELHDKLGATLSTVKLYFESMEEHLTFLKEKNRERYGKAIEMLNDACEDVRSIAYKMGSEILNRFGLGAALENLHQNINSLLPLEVSITHHGLDEERLDYKYEINIFRIIQELINNASKHADATEITAQLIRKEGNLNLIVEDNGKGFNPEETGETGLGLSSIKARVEVLKGDLRIDSGMGSGSTFIIDIPIDPKSNLDSAT
ncbi:MAG: sensor histidine kinase, partial [Cyclobacteriaceae bacterium]